MELLYFRLRVVFLLKQYDSTFPCRNSLFFDPWFYFKMETAYVEFIIIFGKYRLKFWDTVICLRQGMYCVQSPAQKGKKYPFTNPCDSYRCSLLILLVLGYVSRCSSAVLHSRLPLLFPLHFKKGSKQFSLSRWSASPLTCVLKHARQDKHSATELFSSS